MLNAPWQSGPNLDLIDLLVALNAEGAKCLARMARSYAGQPVNYISKFDLIANKEAAGRPQDKIDAEYLRNVE